MLTIRAIMRDQVKYMKVLYPTLNIKIVLMFFGANSLISPYVSKGIIKIIAFTSVLQH